MKQLILLMCLISSLTYVGCRKKCPELPPTNKSNVKMETAIYEKKEFSPNLNDSMSLQVLINSPLITDSVMQYGLIMIYMQKAKNFAGNMDLTKWHALPCVDRQEYPLQLYPTENISYTYSYSKGQVKITLSPQLKMGGMIYNFKIITYRNI
jgi:hypothetical protein